jgi:membrane fusion protein (multidrug efflux system)
MALRPPAIGLRLRLPERDPVSITARRLSILALVLVGVAALLGPRLLSRPGEAPGGPAETPAAVGPRVVPVSVYEVRPQRLAETLATTGTLRANEWVEVVSEVAGKVVEIRFEEGRGVESGQVLARIDDRELSAQRERARYRLQLAEQREAQQKRLLAEGIISQEEYEAELTQRNVLAAELELIATQLAKCEIKAPFAGTVGLRSVSLGSYVSPQTRIATLQDLDPIKLDFSLPEQYSGQVRVGQAVGFRVKGVERAFRGTIYAIEPAVDPETRSLSLRAESPNPAGALLPGGFADVEVTVREVAEALAVPSIAVVPELAGKKVFVVEGGLAETRAVETGIRTAELVEITSGLSGGERVIVSGLQQVRSGQPVAVQ